MLGPAVVVVEQLHKLLVLGIIFEPDHSAFLLVGINIVCDSIEVGQCQANAFSLPLRGGFLPPSHSYAVFTGKQLLHGFTVGVADGLCNPVALTAMKDFVV